MTIGIIIGILAFDLDVFSPNADFLAGLLLRRNSVICCCYSFHHIDRVGAEDGLSVATWS
jgi:hypothetical protein